MTIIAEAPALLEEHTVAAAEPIVITEAGIYELTDEVYHADPVPGGSLSSSGSRKLLPPSCPAKFAYDLAHPQPRKPAFEFGKAAHREVLGAGATLCLVDAADWRTKAAREARDEATANGQTALLPAEYQVVQEMAAAIRRHPIAAALLDPDQGKPEQSMFWRDERTGVMRRARFDWLRDQVTASGRLLIPDYKSAVSAANDDFEKAAVNYGYVQAAPWYVDAAKAVTGCEDAVMLFVVQEKTAPYLVNVIELSSIAIDYGRDLNRQAIDIYARCTETGQWPGYSDGIELISLPGWVERAYMEAKA